MGYFKTARCSSKNKCVNRDTKLCNTCQRNQLVLHDHFKLDKNNLKLKFIKGLREKRRNN